jgi:predicted RNase H-like nuclease (RuvC/YqgF family)
VLGFVVVASELARVQRREFGAPKAWRKLRAWVRRRFGVSDAAELGATIAGRGTASAELTARYRIEGSMEDRVEALAKNLERLDKEVTQERRKLRGEIREVRQKLDELRAQVEREHEQIEEERKEALKSSLAFQWTGTGLFVVGAVLTTIGNVC